jgi:hypothetical protein
MIMAMPYKALWSIWFVWSIGLFGLLGSNLPKGRTVELRATEGKRPIKPSHAPYSIPQKRDFSILEPQLPQKYTFFIDRVFIFHNIWQNTRKLHSPDHQERGYAFNGISRRARWRSEPGLNPN